MPAPMGLQSSTHSANTQPATKHSAAHNRKSRVIKRRGRAKNAIDSDEEIEREVATDSESDDDKSSLDSESDSDTEPASEDVIIANGHPGISSSPTTDPADGSSKDVLTRDSLPNGLEPSFFATEGNWSEMVAEENANGPADLPVIDFADFGSQSNGHAVPPASRSRKAQKSKKRSASEPQTAISPTPPAPSPESTREEPVEYEEPVASTSHQPHEENSPSIRRPTGQSARQAYQQRLEADPSYVPTVGEFWGHDDRLLDKDLRSLSGWWRGRWQGRGRGRGGFDRGFPMRARGRGGFFGGHSPMPNQAASEPTGQDSSEGPGPLEVPPIERAWTHDGFEEMKRKEEQRRNMQQQHQQNQPTAQQPLRGPGGFRGLRGGFRAHGGSFQRGGFNSSPSHSPILADGNVQPPRTWFAMKPERMWTKQHDGFLHFEIALKRRPGQGPGIRIRLPGEREQIVRAPARAFGQSPLPPSQPAVSVFGSDEGERAFVVRIPKRHGKERVAEKTSEVPSAAPQTLAESVTTVEEISMDDIFTVRPPVNTPKKPVSSNQTAAVPLMNGHTTSHNNSAHPNSSQHPESLDSQTSHLPQRSQTLPEQINVQQLEDLSYELPNKSGIEVTLQTEETILHRTSDEDQITEAEGSAKSPQAARPTPSTLPPLRTVFTPPIPQTSPSFVSPYTYAPLPPGIAMNAHGMPYELATGRAVYLQAPMYDPRPVQHQHQHATHVFVPGHMHHPSGGSIDIALAAPQAIPHAHTPPASGFLDPNTGGPLFAFPRQSSRIEIRAPREHGDGSGKVTAKSTRRSSGLRTAAASFEPAAVADSHGSYFPPMTGTPGISDGAGEDDRGPVSVNVGMVHPGSTQIDPAVMAYSTYQQPQAYYYPEPYGYTQYVDMAHTVPYEMYPPQDPRSAQGAVYY